MPSLSHDERPVVMFPPTGPSPLPSVTEILANIPYSTQELRNKSRSDFIVVHVCVKGVYNFVSLTTTTKCHIITIYQPQS